MLQLICIIVRYYMREGKGMRRRKQVLLTVVVVMLMLVVLPLNAMAKSKIIPNDKTGIPDRSLYEAILDHLDKDRDKTFTEEEASKINYLDATSSNTRKEIRTLKGIEKLKNLKFLDASYNKLISIAPVKKLTRLTYLNVSFNKLTSLSGIKNLKSLKKLNVMINNLKNLNGVEKLINLEELNVSDNRLTNLKGVEKLVKLISLSASGNKLTNIKEIRDLRNLTSLNVGSNKITNLNEIVNLTNLSWIYVEGNKLKKLPDLTKHKNISLIELKYNFLNANEINSKLPASINRNDVWFKSQIQMQSFVNKIKLIQPKSFKAISKNTKKIVGTAHKKATIVLREPNGKKIVSVKSDGNGKFIFRKLNLKKWSGMTLSLESYIVDKFYGEKNILKEVKFTVHN